jgi:F0F1-type ATP synthase assembly protein I
MKSGGKTNREKIMFEFIIGVVVGAVFAPFWMKLFEFAKAWATTKLPK